MTKTSGWPRDPELLLRSMIVFPGNNGIRMPRFPVADWLAEQTRLTLFTTPEAVIRPQDWWRTVFDSDPDEVMENLKRGSSVFKGEFDSGEIILKTETGRIDWALTPKDSLVEDGELTVIGPIHDTFPFLADLGERWLAQNDVPSIGRMAFGAVLFHQEADVPTAYERIPDYTGVQIPPGSSDFFFQLNLPPAQSATGIEGLKLNRLSKWQIVTNQTLRFAVSVDGPNLKSSSRPLVALRTELDINTVANFTGAIPKDQLNNLFRELVAQGESIATYGVLAQ